MKLFLITVYILTKITKYIIATTLSLIASLFIVSISSSLLNIVLQYLLGTSIAIALFMTLYVILSDIEDRLFKK